MHSSHVPAYRSSSSGANGPPSGRPGVDAAPTTGRLRSMAAPVGALRGGAAALGGIPLVAAPVPIGVAARSRRRYALLERRKRSVMMTGTGSMTAATSSAW